MEPLEFEVPADYEGQRLDRFLVSVLAEHSRSQIQKLITDGHVTLHKGPGAKALKANAVVHVGPGVFVRLPLLDVVVQVVSHGRSPYPARGMMR